MEVVEMSVSIAHYPEEERLDLTLEAASFDLSQTRQILEATRFVNERLMVCIIDCSRVARVFDSGLAILTLLTDKLAKFRVKLILIGELPGLELDRLLERH
jgi:hypothetical protein